MIRSSRYFGNLPSVKTLTENLRIEKSQAELIRFLIKYGYDYVSMHHEELGLPDPLPKTTKWIKDCYNEPSRLEKILESINEILDGHGVECVRKDGKVALEYINIGDTYIPTIVFDHDAWRFRCCSWGDIVERGRYD
jgi:hypothetical protein